MSRRRTKPHPAEARLAGVVVAVVFACALAAAVLLGRLPLAVPLLYGAASAVAFAVYAADKAAARAARWRTPESTLHVLGVACGWPGALLAQSLLRHKSSKLSFQLVFYVTVALNCGALAWLASAPGASMLRRWSGA